MEHQWSIVKDGRTSTAVAEVDEDNMATVSYEALDELLTRLGFTETTPVNYASVDDDDDYLHALD